MSTTTAFSSMISSSDNAGKARCYSQPSDLAELEQMMAERYGDDSDALPDAWRSARGACKAALTKFAKSGDLPMVNGSSYSFPSDEHISLLAFTLRYTSMGVAFAALLSACKVPSILLDMISYRSMFLSEFGTTPPADSSSADSFLLAVTSDADQCTEAPSEEQVWLWAVGGFMSQCERIIANCSGSTSIALSDTSLFLVREVAAGSDLAEAVLPPVAEFRLTYSDYSVSETGARLWGGGVGLALLLGEKGAQLLAKSFETIDESIVLELGAGVALPTCVLARCASKALVKCSVGPPIPKQLTFVATDCVAPILSCAKKNIERQLALSRDELGDSPITAIRYQTMPLDFFEVANMQSGSCNPPTATAWMKHLCSVDLLLATDVVYDMKIGAAAVSTIAAMMSPSQAIGEAGHATLEACTSLDDVLGHWKTLISGGIALVCCESHRDSMAQLPSWLPEAGLTILWHTKDIQSELRHYTLPKGTTTSSCELYVLAKFDA